MTIIEEEDDGGDEGGAFVAVDEGMVARDAERVSSGEIEGIGIAVGRLIDRARQRRLQEPMVAQAGTAAMLGNLFVVNGEDQRFADHRHSVILPARAGRGGASSSPSARASSAARNRDHAG